MTGPIVAGVETGDLVDQSLPTLTPGTTETLQLYFTDTDDNGSFDYTFDIGGFSGGYRAYRALLNYGYSARDGTIQTGTDDDGTPWFRERLPDDLDDTVTTHLQPVRPGDTRTPAMWTVITGVSDESVSNRPFERLDVEVFVLGRRDDYADRTAVRDAHEVTLGWVVAGQVADALTDATVPTLTRGEEINVEFRFDDLSTAAYSAIRDYTAYPNVATYETDNGIPRFRDRTPSIAPVSDALLKVEPDHTSPGFEDFWVVVVSGEESAAARPQQRIISLSLLVLGTTAEYATESDVRDALEVASV